MAVFENFLVSKLFGLFDGVCQKPNDSHGAVPRFFEIDTNVPSVRILADYGFSTAVVDSSKPWRVGHWGVKNQRGTGRRRAEQFLSEQLPDQKRSAVPLTAMSASC